MNTFADGSLTVQLSLANLFTFRWQFTLVFIIVVVSTNQKSEGERITPRIPESHHSAVHCEDLVLNVAFSHTEAVLMELVAAAGNRHVSRDILGICSKVASQGKSR